jgi:demethylmenaquinone methyltransferase/2-methoxy-6-polyprenyl-1,4-benzoquinol methylase
MAELKGEARARYVQEMFSRIAPRYDLMNRLMTAGQDVRWRAEVIRRARLNPGARLLDLGAGTGDLALEARRQQPGGRVVAADFTLEMLRVGRQRLAARGVEWAGADALALPFSGGVFDAVVSGFLMRNVADLPRALREQHRVLKPGGRIVILDTTQPGENLLAPLLRFHMNVVVPTLGRLVAGDGEAYTYLPDSTARFLQAEMLSALMVQAGFRKVGFRRLMLGAVALHWGEAGP